MQGPGLREYSKAPEKQSPSRLPKDPQSGQEKMWGQGRRGAGVCQKKPQEPRKAGRVAGAARRTACGKIWEPGVQVRNAR